MFYVGEGGATPSLIQTEVRPPPQHRTSYLKRMWVRGIIPRRGRGAEPPPRLLLPVPPHRRFNIEGWVMAGHSQFKNIMHRKGAQDAKRARVFAKLIREITVSAKQGLADVAANPRLRAAVGAALKANMTRDTVDRAIKKATGVGQGEDYVEVRYEGYGPGGVAVIVEALTDNRNRTASDVRSAFAKHGGALGETDRKSTRLNSSHRH